MKCPMFVPKLGGPSSEEVKAARDIIKANDEAFEEQNRNTLVQCQICKKLHQISSLVYIQTYWYVSPHGCTGGDYWRQGEGRFKCDCGHLNRLYESKDVEELKQFFSRIEEMRERG